VISLSRRRSPRNNARALGHTTAEEIKILALHGILHLRGYDHERDGGKDGAAGRKFAPRPSLTGGVIARTSGAKTARSRKWPYRSAEALRHPNAEDSPSQSASF